jgi:hypothetical protein
VTGARGAQRRGVIAAFVAYARTVKTSSACQGEPGVGGHDRRHRRLAPGVAWLVRVACAHRCITVRLCPWALWRTLSRAKSCAT